MKHIPAILIFMAFISKIQAGSFENLATGARTMSMCGNTACLSSDTDSVPQNPAGLYRLSGGRFNFFQADLHGLGLINLNYFGFAKSGIAKGVIGLSWARIAAVKQADFLKYSENIYIFTYSRNLHKRLAGGLNVKFLSAEFSGRKGTGYSADIGFIYSFTTKIDAALSVINFTNPEIIWGAATREKLPSSYSIGASYEAGNLSMEIDIKNREGVEFVPGIGAELSLFKGRAMLRAGANSRSQGIEAGFGAGLIFSKIGLDYGFRKTAGLDPTQGFELKIKF